MRKFRGTTQPEAGKERVFYGRANDPTIASQIMHGVSTKTSLVVRILAILLILHVKGLFQKTKGLIAVKSLPEKFYGLMLLFCPR